MVFGHYTMVCFKAMARVAVAIGGRLDVDSLMFHSIFIIKCYWVQTGAIRHKLMLFYSRDNGMKQLRCFTFCVAYSN